MREFSNIWNWESDLQCSKKGLFIHLPLRPGTT